MIDLKKQLKLHGSNISDVAKKLGMGQPALSQQISNKSIKLSKVVEIANALGISVSDFLAEDGSKVTIICPHCNKPITIHIDSEESEK
jgi:transcriptional regulator with XRE-family HTH domain